MNCDHKCLGCSERLARKKDVMGGGYIYLLFILVIIAYLFSVVVLSELRALRVVTGTLGESILQVLAW